ncbi:MAG: type IV pilus twitching motility protein PilT [Planctomycetota bacterium]|nr:type IV pilus twitching motility protein PilT [Planctomycetota bacterium]
MYSLEDLLKQMVEKNASDLHLSAGTPPRIRIDGDLSNIGEEPLSPDDTQRLTYGVLDSEQIARFEQNWELDLSFGVSGLGRFRTNVFYQRGALGAVMRVIPYQISSFKELGLPAEVCERLCRLPRGLVLVTGATGSGKSTTLAAMIDFINTNIGGHIITVEDPIEFVHRNKKALVNQREVGSDTKSFGNALRHVLRQDPDVVLIGEMRDMETIEAGLRIAETGHLTFATLHTNDATQTMNRIIDVFPSGQQTQIRTQLSFVLEAVFCQQLLEKRNRRGRILASEILLATPAIRSLIRENKAHQLYSVMQTTAKIGMKTMNQSLFELYQHGAIRFEDALKASSDPEDLKNVFQSKSTSKR